MSRTTFITGVIGALGFLLAPGFAAPALAGQGQNPPPALQHLAPSGANVGVGAGGRNRAGRGPDLHSLNMHKLASLPQTDATNSDLSFWGDIAYAGNYGGFRVFNMSDPGAPVELANVDCPGPQNDTSVWGNILILSVDAVMEGPNCGDAQLPNSPTPTEGWEGIRIFDVSDPSDPQFMTSVYTDCGSHTNNIIPDEANNRLLVYVLSYALRPGPTCGAPDLPGSPGNGQISIVAVPLADPASAEVVNIVPIPVNQTFDDLEFIPGIEATDGCHDVQFFLELGIAAAACLSEGQIWDISDPANPEITHHLDNDNIEIWHSATFTWDGKTIVYGDETIFGSCESPDDMHGRIWFYDLENHHDPLGSFLIPRQAQLFENNNGDLVPEYCGSHLFNVLPRRDDTNVLVSSWYGGGTSVVDFTDPANAVEIGYYDPQVPVAETWASYWYNGFIYTNDILRGVDVFKLSDWVGGNTLKFDYLNPQVQENTIPLRMSRR